MLALLEPAETPKKQCRFQHAGLTVAVVLLFLSSSVYAGNESAERLKSAVDLTNASNANPMRANICPRSTRRPNFDSYQSIEKLYETCEEALGVTCAVIDHWSKLFSKRNEEELRHYIDQKGMKDMTRADWKKSDLLQFIRKVLKNNPEPATETRPVIKATCKSLKERIIYLKDNSTQEWDSFTKLMIILGEETSSPSEPMRSSSEVSWRLIMDRLEELKNILDGIVRGKDMCSLLYSSWREYFEKCVPSYVYDYSKGVQKVSKAQALVTLKGYAFSPDEEIRIQMVPATLSTMYAEVVSSEMMTVALVKQAGFAEMANKISLTTFSGAAKLKLESKPDFKRQATIFIKRFIESSTILCQQERKCDQYMQNMGKKLVVNAELKGMAAWMFGKKIYRCIKS